MSQIASLGSLCAKCGGYAKYRGGYAKKCGGYVVGGLGVIIESNLNRVRLSCCWVVFGLGCDNNGKLFKLMRNFCHTIHTKRLMLVDQSE